MEGAWHRRICVRTTPLRMSEYVLVHGTNRLEVVAVDDKRPICKYGRLPGTETKYKKWRRLCLISGRGCEYIEKI